MKRFFFIMVLLIIAILYKGHPVFATYDPSTGINYEISYHTDVTGTARLHYGQELDEILLKSYWNSFSVDITDSSITSEIQKYKDEVFVQVKNYPPKTAGVSPSIINGHTFHTRDEYYFRWLELPQNYNGSSIIMIQDFPLTVTGDGNGNLSMGTTCIINDLKIASFTVPPIWDTTIKEEITSQRYTVSYSIPNSSTPHSPNNKRTFYSGKTLDEVLKHCVQYADLEDRINVSVYQSYSISILTNSTYQMNIDLHYGNTPDWIHSSTQSTRKENINAGNASKKTDTPSTATAAVPETRTSNSATIDSQPSEIKEENTKQFATEFPSQEVNQNQTIIHQRQDEVTQKSKSSLCLIITTSIIIVSAITIIYLAHNKKFSFKTRKKEKCQKQL